MTAPTQLPSEGPPETGGLPLSPAQLRALAADARRDAHREAQRTTTYLTTTEADAIGARYWLERRADLIEAMGILESHRAAGLYSGIDGQAQWDYDLSEVQRDPKPLATARHRLDYRLHTRANLEGVLG